MNRKRLLKKADSRILLAKKRNEKKRKGLLARANARIKKYKRNKS